MPNATNLAYAQITCCVFVGGSMEIYIPHMKLYPLMMYPESMYTENDNDDDASC